MLKYVVYLLVAVLICWSVFYLIRHVRKQLKGDCGSCGGSCGSCHGDCGGCSSCKK